MKIFLIILTCLWASAGFACAPGGDAKPLSAQTEGALAGYAEFAPIPLSQPFAMTLTFCGDEQAAITKAVVEAIMPAHQHGMNYAPVVEGLGQGQFAVSGMVFHMPGLWRVQVSVFGAKRPMHYALEILVK
ncbi:MAG: hypothetical protein WBC85_14080 [Planktotalea sp.]|uniref:hypothetical protein n=1 Tax=Planktotalea sp. TaxID=2029877 RepID=UPI003C729E99